MSYSVSGSGHGADMQKVRDAFRAFVKALDEATDLAAPPPDGWSAPSLFQGGVTGGDHLGSYYLTADQIRQEADEE